MKNEPFFQLQNNTCHIARALESRDGLCANAGYNNPQPGRNIVVTGSVNVTQNTAVPKLCHLVLIKVILSLIHCCSNYFIRLVICAPEDIFQEND